MIIWCFKTQMMLRMPSVSFYYSLYDIISLRISHAIIKGNRNIIEMSRHDLGEKLEKLAGRICSVLLLFTCFPKNLCTVIIFTIAHLHNCLTLYSHNHKAHVNAALQCPMHIAWVLTEVNDVSITNMFVLVCFGSKI